MAISLLGRPAATSSRISLSRGVSPSPPSRSGDGAASRAWHQAARPPKPLAAKSAHADARPAQAFLHVRPLLPHPVGLGQEDQRLRPGVGHVEPFGGREREPGMSRRLGELKPEVIGGRQLQIEHGGGAGRAGLGRGAAGLVQQLGPPVVEQVDRAELVQRVQSPERQVRGPAIRSASSKARRAAPRSRSRAIRPVISSAWQRTRGLAPSVSSTAAAAARPAQCRPRPAPARRRGP
jgi:hypothetical protein